MAKAQVMHGARALVQINKQPVGVFNEVSWVYGLLDAEVDILGAYGTVDVVYVGASAVTAEATGWRVIDHGPMVVASVPKLSELLTYEGVEILIMDRQAKPGDPAICTIRDAKPLGYSGGVAAKQLSTARITFKGTRFEDESGTNEEDASAATLIPAPR
jgi:hypothetical protein